MFENYRFLFAISFLMVISLIGAAQSLPKTRVIPLEMATMRYDDTYIKITYSSPFKNGRVIFGALVPYKKLWNLGASETAELITTAPILVGEDTLQAGAYSLLAIPEKESWTLFFNTATELWGTYRYQEKNDVLTISLPVEHTTDLYEQFQITFRDRELPETFIDITWEKTRVSIPIRFITPLNE